MKNLRRFFVILLAFVSFAFAKEDKLCYLSDANSCVRWGISDGKINTVVITNKSLSDEYAFHFVKEGEDTSLYLGDKLLGHLTKKVSEFGEGELAVAANVSVKESVKKLQKVESCSRNAMNFCYKYSWYHAEVTTTVSIGNWSDTKVAKRDIDAGAHLAFCCN